MQTDTKSTKKETDLNIIDLLMYLASKWRWYLISILLFVGLAWYKYAKSPFVYFRSATVIIKDPSNKLSTTGLDRYDNLINKVNVANEIIMFKSKRLMTEVVGRLNADVSYKIQDGLRQRELYTQAPFRVTFPDATAESYFSFTASLKDDKTVTVSYNDGEETKTKDVKFNQKVNVAGTEITVSPTNYCSKSWYGVEINVSKLPRESVVGYYMANVGINQESEESSILKLVIKDNSASKAEDVLNMLITVYNEDAIKDKNQVAVNTADFINERLIIIEKELGHVESNLESFKSSNQVVDLGSAAGMYMSESQKYNSEALELETQLRLAKYIKEYLTDPSKDTDLIPANTGIKDMNIEGQISQYNTMKLRRDKLIVDSSENNPIVEELNNSLRALKQSIIRAVDNMIVSIDVRRSDAQSRENRAQARVASVPAKERQMLSIERQQKIKEALYLFLLNKREENALSQAMADNNARVIDSADGGDAPISPVRNKILLLGGCVGLALPTVAFLMIMFLDTRVHTRKDVEDAVNVPLLGVIPLNKKSRRKKENSEKKEESSVVSEAFRILRTNMAFLAHKNKNMQVITFTSFNEGAGKTFISLNLAKSFAYANKKVVLLDLDIRKGTLSGGHQHRHQAGVTNYLADSSITVDDIIQKSPEADNIDIIPSGSVAPNPAELLMDERLDALVQELRGRYDYIIADNVPIGIIADAAIANRIADLMRLRTPGTVRSANPVI